MNEITKKLLKKLGLNEEVIGKLSDEEQAKTLKIDELYGTVRGGIATALENDSDFADTIHGKVRAEVLTSKERKLMKLFPKATKDVIEALPANRRFDALLEFLAENYTEAGEKGKDPDDKDKEIVRLTGELKTATEKITKLESEDLPAAQTAAEAKIDSYKADDLIRKKLGEKKLVVGVNAAFPAVAQELAKRHDYKLNDSKESLILFQKGKNLKSMRDTKEATLDEELDDILTALELKEVSAGPPDPKKKDSGGKGSGGKEGERTTLIESRSGIAAEHAKSMFPSKKE